MKYLSLFSGIGGFELGIKQAYESNNEYAHKCKKSKQEERTQRRKRFIDLDGVQLYDRDRSTPLCVGYSEIDKYAIQVYEKHFNHKNYGDITKINEKELPNFDLLCGGFPCQAFSIAGKRGGFEDTRGTLFFDIARILREKQPSLLLLENVKGLLSHDEGRTFTTIITTLDELGYDLQWQVLNSKNFGVPQNRERVFIVGHSRNEPRPQVFPFGESDGLSFEGGRKGEAEDRVAPAVTSNLKRGVHSGGEAYIARTVRSGRRSSPHGSKQNWDSYEFDGQIRRLTPTECERLQGFPDGWTEGLSDTQRYKTLGNAVTVNVIQAIVEKMFKNDIII